ncbi:unnamed protein product [Boreogadus saida]
MFSVTWPLQVSSARPGRDTGRDSENRKDSELTVHRSDVCLSPSAPAKLHSKMAATTAALGEGSVWTGPEKPNPVSDAIININRCLDGAQHINPHLATCFHSL